MRLATATVRINVLRDTGVLAFSANNYNVTISENTPVGSSVTNTVASPGVCLLFLFYLSLATIDDNEKEVEVLKNF